MYKHDVIVIGASAGGVEALMELTRALPASLPAAVFIVLHVASKGLSILPQILARQSPLSVHHPVSGGRIEHGHIYVAPNDKHMLIEENRVILSSGPRENGFRPAIDPLFRTAAKSFGSRVVGVILTGMLDNGVGGLAFVKERGGIAIVQDPASATFPVMPESALQVVKADYVLPLDQIAETLVQLSVTEAPEPVIRDNPGHAPEQPLSDNPEHDASRTGDDEGIYQGQPDGATGLICPECGGVLVEFQGGENGKLINYRCRVGHRYSLHSMVEHQGEAAEAALWAAVRALEETSTVAQRMADHARGAHDLMTAERFVNRGREADKNANIIRQILLDK